jgi:hypothetical protein
MKSTTKNEIDLNKEFYNVKEIAKLINFTSSWTVQLLNKMGFLPSKIEIRNSKLKVFYYHKFDVYKFLNLDVCIPITKKRRKPYFEFSSLIVESKINQNGID